MKKRLKRTPKAKEGELKIAWGKDPDGYKEDIIYVNGPGTSRPDGHLMYHIFGCERCAPDWSKPGSQYTFEKSFIDELEARGYDITTLKFSIQKKKKKEDEVKS